VCARTFIYIYSITALDAPFAQEKQLYREQQHQHHCRELHHLECNHKRMQRYSFSVKKTPKGVTILKIVTLECPKNLYNCHTYLYNCHTLYYIKDVPLQPKFNHKQNSL